MGRALGLSASAESLVQVEGASGFSIGLPDTAIDPSRRSAGILTHPKLNLAEARAILRAHAKDVIFGAFWDGSQHATCIRAAQACGVSPDKIERLIKGEAESPDAVVLGFCAGVYTIKTRRESPIRSVLAQIIAADCGAISDASFLQIPDGAQDAPQP